MLIFLLLFSSPLFSAEASYDKGPDLIPLQGNALLWYTTKDRNPQGGERDPYGYHAIFWKPNSNEFFHGFGTLPFSNLPQTNGFSYKIDTNINIRDSKYTHRDTNVVMFAGYISSNQRLYIDNDHGDQYIVTITNILDKEPVYPLYGPLPRLPSWPEKIGFLTAYTNSKGERFSRSVGNKYTYGKGQLIPWDYDGE